MKDKVSLIKRNGDIVGFKVNDKEFFADNGRVEVQVDDLKGVNISSIPDEFFLSLARAFSKRKRQ